MKFQVSFVRRTKSRADGVPILREFGAIPCHASRLCGFRCLQRGHCVFAWLDIPTCRPKATDVLPAGAAQA